MKNPIKKGYRFLSEADPRYLCLALAAGLECLLISFGPLSIYILNHFTMVPCFLFLACVWKQPLSSSAKKQFLLCAAMVLWFTLVQNYHYIMDASARAPGMFFTVFLLAFPFAVSAKDSERQLGMKITGGFFLCGALVLALFTGLLALGFFRYFLTSYIYWDGARLAAMWHPNITANCFLIAIGFCLYFCTTVRRRCYRAVFLALAVLFFLLISLTNSRTAVLTCCILVAGTVFFLIWKGGVKRFLLGAVAALVVMVLMFVLYQTVFSLHEDHLIQSYLQELEATGSTNPDLQVDQQTGQASLHTDSGQNTLAQDIGTLNFRTAIWSSSIRIIQEDPMILVRGTPFIADLLTARHAWVVTHSHNSWLDTLLGLGLPGLFFALIFTGLALWHILRLFFFGNHSLSRKIIALLTLCLLISGILENYLFLASSSYQCANFAFFFCLGYLTQWKKAE